MIWTKGSRFVVALGLAAWIAPAPVASAPTTPWQMRLTWGDSIPGGTVYTVTLDDAGALNAERQGMPFTDQGLTVVRHQGTVPADTVAAIRSAAATLDKRFNPRKARGSMLGDGGFMDLEIRKGTAVSKLGVGRLAHLGEAGEAWVSLLILVRKVLPNGFVE